MAGFSFTPVLVIAVLVMMVFQVEGQCQTGDQNCSDGNSCRIGGLLYCCPGALMTLTWDYGKVTSCQCDSSSGTTGTVCSGNGGQGNAADVTSASWLSCALTTVAATLVTLWR